MFEFKETEEYRRTERWAMTRNELFNLNNVLFKAHKDKGLDEAHVRERHEYVRRTVYAWQVGEATTISRETVNLVWDVGCTFDQAAEVMTNEPWLLPFLRQGRSFDEARAICDKVFGGKR